MSQKSPFPDLERQSIWLKWHNDCICMFFSVSFGNCFVTLQYCHMAAVVGANMVSRYPGFCLVLFTPLINFWCCHKNKIKQMSHFPLNLLNLINLIAENLQIALQIISSKQLDVRCLKKKKKTELNVKKFKLPQTENCFVENFYLLQV